MRDPHDIIERPLLTEKSNDQAAMNKYHFRVRLDANKIEIAHASDEQFVKIFEAECQRRGLDYEHGIPEYVGRYITQEMKQPLCQCFPHDLLNQIFWIASYQGVRPELNPKTLGEACQRYFLSAKMN